MSPRHHVRAFIGFGGSDRRIRNVITHSLTPMHNQTLHPFPTWNGPWILASRTRQYSCSAIRGWQSQNTAAPYKSGEGCGLMFNTHLEAFIHTCKHANLLPVKVCQCGPIYHDAKAAGDHLWQFHNPRVDGLLRSPMQVVLVMTSGRCVRV